MNASTATTLHKVPFGQKVAFGLGMLANQMFPAALGIFMVVLVQDMGFPTWMWGILFGSAFLMIPGLGPIMVGGPLVSWIIGALETAVLTGGLTALGGALASIGIPHDSVIQYETALKANKFIVIVHGTLEEVEKAKNVLMQNKAETTEVYKFKDVAGKQPEPA